MGPRLILINQLAAVSCAAFFIGCTSMNEVTWSNPEEGDLTTAEFNEIAEGRKGVVSILEETRPSNAIKIEASADSLYWTDDAGLRMSRSLGDVNNVQVVSSSAGFWEGAKWGAAIGAAVGVGLAAAEVSSAQGAEAKDMAPLAYFVFPPLGAIVGGLAGGAYGSTAGHTFHCTFRPKGL